MKQKTEPDAKLISAVPGLLEALKVLCNSFQWYMDTNPDLFCDEDKAELAAGYAAIAEATGEKK